MRGKKKVSNDKKDEGVSAIVEEALPDAMFRVVIDSSNEKVIAYLSGKMRLYRIKILVGDKVILIPDPYGGKARIIKRL